MVSTSCKFYSDFLFIKSLSLHGSSPVSLLLWGSKVLLELGHNTADRNSESYEIVSEQMKDKGCDGFVELSQRQQRMKVTDLLSIFGATPAVGSVAFSLQMNSSRLQRESRPHPLKDLSLVVLFHIRVQTNRANKVKVGTSPIDLDVKVPQVKDDTGTISQDCTSKVLFFYLLHIP